MRMLKVKLSADYDSCNLIHEHLTLFITIVIVAGMGEDAIRGNENRNGCTSSSDGPSYTMLIPMNTALKNATRPKWLAKVKSQS